MGFFVQNTMQSTTSGERSILLISHLIRRLVIVVSMWPRRIVVILHKIIHRIVQVSLILIAFPVDKLAL